MVNFNDASTMSIPISDVKKLLIMEKRERVNNAVEDMNNNGQQGDHDEIMIVRSRIISLYNELRTILIEHYMVEHDIIQSLSYSYNLNDLLNAYRILDDKVYKLIEANKELIL